MEASYGVVHSKEILEILLFLLVGGVAALWATWKLKIPDIAIYLILGIVLGSAGILNISSDSTVNQLLLTFGAAALLFEGGTSVRFDVLKRVIGSVISLATVGVIVTAAVTAAAAHYLLGIDWIFALLMASVIASTDPATLVPVFRQVKIKEHVEQTVVTESAFNDATGAILTFSVLGVVLGGTESFTWGGAVTGLLWQSLGGAAIGTVLALTAAVFIAEFEWMDGYEPVLVPLLIAGSYLAATAGCEALHLPEASGFMAVFMAGLIFANASAFKVRIPEEDLVELHSFLGHTTLMLRMCIFLLLGSQVDFAVLAKYWIPALGVVAVFMLIARPLTVLASCLPDRKAKWEKNELIFMFWTRETGVIPAALAGFLSAALSQHSKTLIAAGDVGGMGTKMAELGPMIASVTFMAILLTILVQATTTKLAAKKLNLLREE